MATGSVLVLFPACAVELESEEGVPVGSEMAYSDTVESSELVTYI